MQILHGDCRDVIKALADCSVDSVVTDPPYALVSIQKRFGKPGSAPAKGGVYARGAKGFMGKQWDTGEVAFDPAFWTEVYRVLKPGGHVLAFGGTRTYHRLACAIEDAGFEIRDQIGWLYGSGFPKSHDVSKSITKRTDPSSLLLIKTWLSEQFDHCGKSKAQINRECGFTASDYLKTEPGNDAGGRATWHLLLPYGSKWARLKEVVGFDGTFDAEIERLGVIAAQREQPKATKEIYGKFSGVVTDYNLTDAARQWQGWGTALKPAWEPIVLARKPMIGTVAANVLAHGTGAINVDACRVHADDAQGGEYTVKRLKPGAELNKTGGNWRPEEGVEYHGEMKPGRWPANILHDGSAEVLAAFPEAPGQLADASSSDSRKTQHVYGAMRRGNGRDGEASADRRYTENGATNFAALPGQRRGDSGSAARFFYCAKAGKKDRHDSKHPTVKPIKLLRYLCRLVTPPGGTILDPFAGSGTTGEAAIEEGFSPILIEREADYFADIQRRMTDVVFGA